MSFLRYNIIWRERRQGVLASCVLSEEILLLIVFLLGNLRFLDSDTVCSDIALNVYCLVVEIINIIFVLTNNLIFGKKGSIDLVAVR